MGIGSSSPGRSVPVLLLLLAGVLASAWIGTGPDAPRAPAAAVRPTTHASPPHASALAPPAARESVAPVEDEAGRPIPDAARAGARRASLRVVTVDQGGEPASAVEVRVEARGRIAARSVTSPDGVATFSSLRVGVAEVVAVRGAAVLALRVVRLRGDHPNDCVLAVRPAGPRLFGRITESSGRPETELVLALHRVEANASTEASVSLLPAADGTYRTPPLQPGRHLLTLRTAHRGREVDRRFVEIGADDVRLDLILAPGAAVGGAVRDTAGNPLAATVLLHRPGTADAPPATHHAATEPSTGRYELTGIAPGAYRARIEAHGHATLLVPIEIPHSGRGDLDWMLAAGGSIHGVVRTDGRPVAEAEVELVRFDADGAELLPGSVFTRDDGRFTAEGVPFGRYRVRVIPSDHAWVTRDDVVVSSILPRAEVAFDVTDGATLVGAVSSAAGDPRVDRVVLRLDSADLGWRVVGVPVDDSGRFRLEHVPPGRLDLEARLGDRRARRRDVRFVEEGETTWSVVFDP